MYVKMLLTVAPVLKYQITCEIISRCGKVVSSERSCTEPCISNCTLCHQCSLVCPSALCVGVQMTGLEATLDQYSALASPVRYSHDTKTVSCVFDLGSKASSLLHSQIRLSCFSH